MKERYASPELDRLKLREQVQYLRVYLQVEGGLGFVTHDELRGERRELAPDADAAAAARLRARVGVLIHEGRVQADAVHQRRDAVRPLRFVRDDASLISMGSPNRRSDRQPWIQARVRVLEDHLDLPQERTACRVAERVRGSVPLNRIVPAFRLDEPEHRARDGRFAAPPIRPTSATVSPAQRRGGLTPSTARMGFWFTREVDSERSSISSTAIFASSTVAPIPPNTRDFVVPSSASRTPGVEARHMSRMRRLFLVCAAAWLGLGCSAGSTSGSGGTGDGRGGNSSSGGAGSGGQLSAVGDAGKSFAVHFEQGQVEVQTVVLNCAGDCADIVAVATGGYAPYSFAWDDGSTNATRHVCPSSTSSYRVSVTDSGTESGEFSQPPATVQASLERHGDRAVRSTRVRRMAAPARCRSAARTPERTRPADLAEPPRADP